MGWAKRQETNRESCADLRRRQIHCLQRRQCEDAGDVCRIPEFERKLRPFYAYFTSFTSGDAHRVVRHSGGSQGLEAWRRLHSEYSPTSSMSRVTILGVVRNPTTCGRIEFLGFALEDWLAKKASKKNSRIVPSRVQDDSLMGATLPKSLGKPVMNKGNEDTAESFFDRLVSFASVHHSLRLDDKPVRAGAKRDLKSMEVYLLNKGARRRLARATV